jgi:hypothetical protein
MNITQKNSLDEIHFSSENTPPKKVRKYSTTSSDSDSFISNINAEIKKVIENEENLSFSSNSEEESPLEKNNIDYLLESRFWRSNKNFSYDMDYNHEKKIFGSGEKKGKTGEESNKQSTQGNEDEETRFEPLQNTISTESNNSPLISLTNNESCENEINCDKISAKEEKGGNNNEQYNNNDKSNNKDDKEKNDFNKNNNKDNINLMNANLLINGSNFTNNINYKNSNLDSKFVYPYEPVNYMTSQSGANFFPNSYLTQNFRNFSSGYNLPSPLGNRTIFPLNDNNYNKLSKALNEKNTDNSEQNGVNNNNNINGQNNTFVNSTNNNFSKAANPNQKNINELPLILNQNNARNMPLNYNVPKLNLNMTYYPKIQNCTLPIHKQSIDKINSSNSLPELKTFSNNNTQDKKVKNNNTSNEANNSLNNNNNYNFTNNKMNSNFNNKNINNNYSNMNNKGQKGEKQFLNLDDIANGKDLRTTIMIRNIPIKYTDEKLNEEFKEFHGKYDCLYMPYDYEKNGNRGYAFINFVNSLHILLFYEKFNGKKWIHFESSKICELNMAHFQGFNEIQKHAKNFKELKKTNFSKSNENMVIPSKYLSKLKKRFPKMKYTENKNKKEFVIKAFE